MKSGRPGAPGVGIRGMRERLRQLVGRAASAGNCVIVGRGSQHLLRDREARCAFFFKRRNRASCGAWSQKVIAGRKPNSRWIRFQLSTFNIIIRFYSRQLRVQSGAEQNPTESRRDCIGRTARQRAPADFLGPRRLTRWLRQCHKNDPLWILQKYPYSDG
jgi:hypothetical protein